jgi:uncharacterized membrane protein YgdD (TMEM256/DUF423 family)
VTAGRNTLIVAGALLALATLLGAFAAHGLQNRLSIQQLHVFETGVRYHFYHALGLLGIGLASQHFQSGSMTVAAMLVGAGIVLFSGSLYLLSFGGPRFLGPITPLGGLALIAGWVAFAYGVWSSSR